MKIDRRDLKWRARDAVGAARPNARLMTLVYLLLTSGVSVVVGLFTADPLGGILGLYQQGMPLDRAIPLAIAGVGSIGLFANILIAIFQLVLDFGYRSWCLNTARGESGEFGDLIDGFSMVGCILWLRILVLMYRFLWYLAIFMPAAFVIAVGMWIPSVVGLAVCVSAFVAAFVAWLSRILRYSMAIYCLADEPEMGASWALRRSRWIMEGRVKDYVLLMLSFLGWHLLSTVIVTAVESVVIIAMGGPHLLMGMDLEALELISNSAAMTVALTLASWPLGLWLKPYVTMTECKFYEQIKIGPSEQPPF